MFYIYDPETKELIKETQGQPNPKKEGTFLTPPFSTTKKPPIEAVGKKAVFNGVDAWAMVDDNRGKNYWNKTTKEKIMFALGDSVDLTMTDKEPIGLVVFEESTSSWIDDLNELKSIQVAKLSSDCEAEIVSGFTSSALGTEHTYQSDRDDQTNLIGMVAGGTADYFKCSDGTAWGYKLHTAAQLKQVLNDGKAVKLSKLQIFAQKKASVEEVFVSQVQGDGGAADLNEAVSIIEAITW